jgi:hypothetical protein
LDERWKAEKREAAQLRREQWLDFDMRGDELLCVTRVFREQLNSRDVDKRYCIENTATNLDDLRKNGGLDPDSRQAWWEKGNWLNQRFVEIGLPGKEFIAEGLIDILVLALMDKSLPRENPVTPIKSRVTGKLTHFGNRRAFDGSYLCELMGASGVTLEQAETCAYVSQPFLDVGLGSIDVEWLHDVITSIGSFMIHERPPTSVMFPLHVVGEEPKTEVVE